MSRGIGSRSEQAAYLCAANVTYANEMLMNNHLFTLLMTSLRAHIAKMLGTAVKVV
jgi:hypothetical protein